MESPRWERVSEVFFVCTGTFIYEFRLASCRSTSGGSDSGIVDSGMLA